MYIRGKDGVSVLRPDYSEAARVLSHRPALHGMTGSGQ